MSALRRSTSAQQLSIFRPQGFPYEDGKFLKVRLLDPTPSGAESRVVRGKIIKLLSNTLAPTMILKLHYPAYGLEGLYVLKVMNRQTGGESELRKDFKMNEWSEEIERKYRAFCFSRQHCDIWQKLEASNEKEEDDDSEHWTEVQNETVLQNWFHKQFDTERKVYNLLADLQGIDIPRLYSCVEIPDFYISQNCQTPSDPRCNTVSGFLMQYIHGSNLFDLYDKSSSFAPKEAWQNIGAEAVHITCNIRDRKEALNNDVKTRNFVARWDPAIYHWKVFMLDFGNCEIRLPETSDRDWREKQAHTDEEGAIAVCYRGGLRRKYKWEFQWEESDYAKQLAYDFMGEHGPRI